MRNKLLNLALATSLIVLGSGCGERVVPTREASKTREVAVWTPGFGHVWLEDVDGDGLVDGIRDYGDGQHVRYFFKGYENRIIGNKDKSIMGEMPWAVRAAASRALRGGQDLGFEMAQDRYNHK